MTITLNGTSGVTTPGVVNTAAETIATTLAVTGASTLAAVAATTGTFSSTLAVTGVTTIAAGSAALPALTTTGDTNTGVWFPAADTVAASTGGSERMRINSSGSVGIGETSPSNARLYVTSDGSVIDTVYVKNTNTSAGTNNSVVFVRGSSVVGTIQTTLTTTAYNTSSDYRLKEDIAPMVGALAKVTALKPVTYKWKLDGSSGQGFIAHELQEVVDGCVSGEKDAVDADGKPQYQGVDTSFLVATLTAAIQELKAIINTQATRIAALEAKV